MRFLAFFLAFCLAQACGASPILEPGVYAVKITYVKDTWPGAPAVPRDTTAQWEIKVRKTDKYTLLILANGHDYIFKYPGYEYKGAVEFRSIAKECKEGNQLDSNLFIHLEPQGNGFVGYGSVYTYWCAPDGSNLRNYHTNAEFTGTVKSHL